MTHETPPVDPGDYPAQPAALGTLFDRTAQELVARSEPSDYITHETTDGFPVVIAGAPIYQVEVDSSRIKLQLPEVASALDVGAKITVHYTLRYRDARDSAWVPAVCGFDIDGVRGLPAGESMAALWLEDKTEVSSGADVREIVSSRTVFATESEELAVNLSEADHLWGILHADQLERQLGMDRMTVAECGALQTIVDNLDALTEVA